MKKTVKIITSILVGILAFLGVILIALFIYWFPVLDRLYFNTCNYYPHTFKDCVEQRSNT